MEIKACAKINLGLNVIERRPDGYHNLQTVFYPVGIYDTINVEESDTVAIHVYGAAEDIPYKDNLVFKAYNMLTEDYALPPISISLKKDIPMQAGMGGGSADCAFTIRAINEMYDLRISTRMMQRYAARLGADCAFFITAEPSYATGIGDELTPITPHESLKDKVIAIVKPDVAVSTAEAYRGITPRMPRYNCREVVEHHHVAEWRSMLTNDFEETVFKNHIVLGAIKQRLYDLGALYAAMSGSGSAMFGIFRREDINIATLEDNFRDCRNYLVDN